MKITVHQFSFLVLWFLIACALTVSAQITPSADAYTNSGTPTANYGSKTVLDVDGAMQITYIQFDLGSIPSGSVISQATLKLYVDSVPSAGSFNVDYVNGVWTESKITYSNAPALGNTIAANVNVTTADKNQYILINVTPALQAWLSGSQANDGIALVANGSFNATFDSKESTKTSHPAELDVVFGGNGTITGVTAGSGLTGGGTSGDVTLSLLTSCAANQVLQWNGSTWVCSSAGTGTITGVTAGTDLTGGGTGGNVTLNLNTTATDARYAQLAAENVFTGNQSINGGLSATASISGQTGTFASNNSTAVFNVTQQGTGNAIAASTAGGAPSISGSSSNTSGIGVFGNASGKNGVGVLAGGSIALSGYGTVTGVNGVAPLTGVIGNSTNTSGGVGMWGVANGVAGIGTLGTSTTVSSSSPFSAGIQGVAANSWGKGVWGQSGSASLIEAYPEFGIGVWGDSANGRGVLGSSDNSIGVTAINNTSGSPALYALNEGGGADIQAGALEVYLGGISIGTFQVPASSLDIAGAGLNTYIGDPHCGAGTVAVGFGTSGFNTCNNYALRGDNGGNLYINSNSTGWIFFDSNNNGLMSIDPSGNVSIKGNLSKGGGSFKIDHPLDPANKYLYHSFVESPDMMNIYNGVVTLDANGSAWITMPDYFQALNRDFRYQLTSLGRPQPNLYVAKEISHNRFKVAGGKAGGRVSWQITGIRHDAYANAHRVQVEVEKSTGERGTYLHPELFEAGKISE